MKYTYKRCSQIRDAIRNNRIANSIKLNVSDGSATEIAAQNGFDAIWVCVEHIANDWSLIEKQIWISKAYDVDLLVRVSRGSYSDLVKPLELDATGIIVPHVMNKEDAERVVHQTRFNPIGMRSLDGGNSDGNYGSMPMEDYLNFSNDEKLIVLQIEDPEAVDDIEAICQVEGYDMLFFGPGDYAHAIGLAGQINHTKVIKARQRVAEVAKKYGRYLGTVSTLDMMNDLMGEGYQLINLGSDVNGLNNYYKSILEEFKNTISNKVRT